MWFAFWSILVCKIPQLWEKLPIQTAHHTFLESRHPEVIKNPHYVLSHKGSQKKRYQLMDYTCSPDFKEKYVVLTGFSMALFFINLGLVVFLIRFSDLLYFLVICCYMYFWMGNLYLNVFLILKLS